MRPIGNKFMSALVKANSQVQVHTLPVGDGDTRAGETDSTSPEPVRDTEVSPGESDDLLDIATYLSPTKQAPAGYPDLVLQVCELAYDVRAAKVDHPEDTRLAEVLEGLTLIEKLLSNP